jgi:hypothetical protein
LGLGPPRKPLVPVEVFALINGAGGVDMTGVHVDDDVVGVRDGVGLLRAHSATTIELDGRLKGRIERLRLVLGAVRPPARARELASVVFGFDHVGRFCLLATPALVVASAMRSGLFPFVFGRRELVRAMDPRGFWIAVGLSVALAGVELWFFIDDLQR